MSEHLYPCRIRTDPLAICDCKTNHMPKPTASDECREAFENNFAHLILTSNKFGDYTELSTHFAWRGWKAAWHRRAPAPAQAEGEVVASQECALCSTRREPDSAYCWDHRSHNPQEKAEVAAWRFNRGQWVGGEPTSKHRAYAENRGFTIEYAYSKPSPQQGKSEQGEAAPYCWLWESDSGEWSADYRTEQEAIQHMGESNGRIFPLYKNAAPAAPQPTAEGECFRRAIELLTSSRSYVKEKTGYGLDDFAYKLVAEIDQFVEAQEGKV